jgi:hypothetical protein
MGFFFERAKATTPPVEMHSFNLATDQLNRHTKGTKSTTLLYEIY